MILWMIVIAWRTRREYALPGHHPRLMLTVSPGCTRLDTSNDALADELLALNPNARRMPTPRRWQRRIAARLPAARALPDDER